MKAKLLITAGSPLGVDIVKQRLGKPLVCLKNVDKWLNVSDKEDFVALYPELNEKSFGCGKIKNITGIDNGDQDAHNIIAYLKHPEVAKVLNSFI